MLRIAAAILVCSVPASAEISDCACDPAREETLQARECSLTRETLKQPPGPGFYFVRDANPRKSNRTLIIPRQIHAGSLQKLHQLAPTEREALWTAAIAKARELWGDDWGLAYNGDKVRTQCQLHVHIGKLLKGVDSGKAIYVTRVADIPVPTDGTGLWIHPVGNRLKVHLQEQICETVLLR